MDRRQFSQTLSGCALGFAAPALAAKPNARKRPPICVYSEHFQSLPIPKMCRIFQQMGVDGIDLTVRRGGHIQPQNAKRELPGAVKAASDHGLKIMMLTTGITSPDRQALEILATCDKLGIERVKMGYYHIGRFGELSDRLKRVRRQLSDLVQATKKFKVRPCVHVHSGATIPSNGFMLHQLLQDLPPQHIGAYLDSFHMAITGGNGGWSQAIDLLRPWISLVALKNFRWQKGNRDKLGRQQWGKNYCRLQDGVAPIPAFVRTVQRAGYRGFYTLHTEYRRPVVDCIRMTTDDFKFLKRVFAAG